MTPLTILEIVAWIQAGQALVGVAGVTIAQFRAFFKSMRPDMSESDMNAICGLVIAGATWHKVLADADAGPTQT